MGGDGDAAGKAKLRSALQLSGMGTLSQFCWCPDMPLTESRPHVDQSCGSAAWWVGGRGSAPSFCCR